MSKKYCILLVFESNFNLFADFYMWYSSGWLLQSITKCDQEKSPNWASRLLSSSLNIPL